MVLFYYFQDGDHLPFLICYTRVWTTHEEYLLAIVNVQYIVRYDTVD